MNEKNIRNWHLSQDSVLIDLNKYDKFWIRELGKDQFYVFSSNVNGENQVSLGVFMKYDHAHEYLKNIYEIITK